MAIKIPELQEDPIHKALKNHLEREYERMIEEECQKAMKEIRRRMKAEQDRVVLSMLNEYSVERRGPELRITVKHFYEKPPAEKE